VGHDDQGRRVRRTLTDDGIVVDGLVTSGMTAHSVNVMDATGSRRNFYDPRLTDVDPPGETTTTSLLDRSRIAHVNIPDWARRVLEPARERGVTLVVDVQDASGLDDSYRRDFVRAADLLFVSADRLADPEGYARGAMEMGHAQAVVVGRGSRGCLLVPRDQSSRTFPAIGTLPDDGSGHASRPVLDTNGAGDSLAVGVASALLLDGHCLDAAVSRGLLCARWCCTLHGTSDGLAVRAQVEAWEQALRTQGP
jgi:sugar/nucleoside kinase (ribokinase family)